MANETIKDGVVHSEIGASSMYRWAACPGSVRLSRGTPSRSSKYAEEGTLAHTVAAYILENDKWPPEIPFDEEMNDAVKVYVDYVKDLIGWDGWAGVIYVEHRFNLSKVFPGLFGTADTVVYDHTTKTLHVIDYKHGQGIPVEAKDNPQLQYYGLGALLSFTHEIEMIVMTIVQPRCGHPEGPIRSWAQSVDELFDFSFAVYEKATATQKDDAPIIPGDHCQFCPASGICPKLQETAQDVAKREFGSHLSYDPLTLSDTLQKLDAVEAWTKGVRAFAYSELEHGREIPGWKLVQKRAHRKWTNVDSVKELISKVGLESGCFSEPELKSVAQVEKVLGKNVFAKNLTDFVTQESSGLALATVDDPRPAAKVSAAEEFEQIPMMENQT